MSAARKLAIVVAVQFLVLFSVIGFKQYTVWTGETVLLKVQPVDPTDIIRGDYVRVRYDISTIDENALGGDDYVSGDVYVELQRGDDGYWHAVAVRNDRERSIDGTVLIKGNVIASRQFTQSRTKTVEYGIEDIFVPKGSGKDLPRGASHAIAVKAKVDRFGNAVTQQLIVDGQPFP